ncbi:glutamate N-acetyltransferase [Arboricoccus pini]|uniref:Arginine biosynthesis bifunctional protein ArgJ n=1 Tax=Arboricoccus pini TaxID=1963835 RepID=A0A212R691_9PROT|nr:bifunctional glutamate N-acetyltransferase/amino-acid acetyltransferase ArgJ [Arboricoccus pini]SNB67699.1 glutamate N-acetyltransferase [Arboricoccus pini]
MAKITETSPLAPPSFPALPAVAGFRFATLEAGIRYKGRRDLTLIEAAPGTSVAAVFTKSATAGHPVLWGRRILPHGKARAVIINAGNANVFRGAEGDAAVKAEAEMLAAALDCAPEEIYVASTGVIGERLPVEKIIDAIPALIPALAVDGIAAAASAIMTTDTFPKGALATAELGGKTVTIAGIAKGSGMIAPDMATMLAFVVTDADLPPAILQPLLLEGSDKSFNATTVDGDTSTSDTLLLLASGKAGNTPVTGIEDPALAAFKAALDHVLLDLALQVVRDGEGAQKLIQISVSGALDDRAARRLGLVVANSPLVKTAIAGGDANWGRIIMAVGRAGETIELARLGVAFGGTPVARNGGAVPDLDEAPVAAHLAGQKIDIDIEVGTGPGKATVWTCDLTHGYIDINADYRS